MRVIFILILRKERVILIEVSVRKNKVELKGHAGRKGKDGIDRACTAVSALTNSLIN